MNLPLESNDSTFAKSNANHKSEFSITKPNLLAGNAWPSLRSNSAALDILDALEEKRLRGFKQAFLFENHRNYN